MPSSTLVSAGQAIKVKVGGSPLPEPLHTLMTDFVLEDSIELPDVLQITYFDPQGVFPRDLMKIGTTIEVVLGSGGAGEATYKAEVTGISCRYSQDGGAKFIVRALDHMHRLHRGRVNMTFKDAKLDDIFTQVLAQLGVDSSVRHSTSVNHKYLSIVDETPYRCLSRLAADADRVLLVDDGVVTLAKRPPPSAPLELEFGGQLQELDVDITGSGLAKGVEVRGWDPQKKEAASHLATLEKPAGSFHSSVDPTALSRDLAGTPDKLIVGTPAVYLDAEAKPIAESLARTLASGIIEVYGKCSGEPTLRSGSTVKITNVSEQFAGEYVVTTTRHLYDLVDGYRTEFLVTGDQDRTLLGLAGGGGGGDTTGPGRRGGVFPAIVTQNEDDESLGRVKVKFPWASEEHESGWIRVATAMAGPEVGALFMPEIDDEVLCAFEDGDANRPVVIGSLWNGQDKLPTVGGGEWLVSEKVVRRGIVTKKAMVTIEEESDKVIVTLGSRDEKFMLVLDQENDTVRIVSDGKVEIEAKKDVTFKTDAAVTMEATGKLTLKGNGIELKDTGGAELTLQATAKLKGATVAIN